MRTQCRRRRRNACASVLRAAQSLQRVGERTIGRVIAVRADMEDGLCWSHNAPAELQIASCKIQIENCRTAHGGSSDGHSQTRIARCNLEYELAGSTRLIQGPSNDKYLLREQRNLQKTTKNLKKLAPGDRQRGGGAELECGRICDQQPCPHLCFSADREYQ